MPLFHCLYCLYVLIYVSIAPFSSVPDNFIANARRKVVGTLEAQLNAYEEDGESTETVADIIANILNDLLGDNGLDILQKNKEITVTYYENVEVAGVDKFQTANVTYDKERKSEIKSLMFTIPFGQNFSVPIPGLNFKLPSALPFTFEVSDNEPSLVIEWQFDLAFGYDEDSGFFIYTFPEDKAEFFIQANANLIKDANINATLLYFLDFELKNTNIEFGAGFFVDIDKERALGIPHDSDDVETVNYGRLTRDMIVNKVPRKKDIFSICAKAAAAFTVDTATVALDNPIPNTAAFDDVIKWIPSLVLGNDTINALEIVVKKEISLSSTSQRKGGGISAIDQRRLDSSIPMDTHRGLRMLTSDCDEDVLNLTFSCPFDEDEDEFFCAQLADIKLDADKIVDLVSPIVDKIANENKNGTFDEIVKPLLPLREPLPGISDVAGKDITILDIAEIYVGEKSGVRTVKKLLELYDSIVKLSELFESLGDTILLAETCVFKLDTGMNCSGGLTKFKDDDGTRKSRRLIQMEQEMEEAFPLYDSSGLRMTPSQPRFLMNVCGPSFDDDDCGDKMSCSGTGCTGTLDKAKCKGRQARCFGSKKGVSFPFLSDPASLLGLLEGKDIGTLDYISTY